MYKAEIYQTCTLLVYKNLSDQILKNFSCFSVTDAHQAWHNKVHFLLLFFEETFISFSAFQVFSFILHDALNLASQAGETRSLIEAVQPALLHQAVDLQSECRIKQKNKK